MKSIKIEGTPRELGSKAAKLMRREGLVPCVIYGGENNVHFAADARALDKILYTPDVYEVTIDVAGTAYKTVVQDTQFHPVTDKTVHVDFIQLFDDKKVKIKLPVALEGVSPGVKVGGRLMLNKRKITLKGLPGDLPETIVINIEALKIGDKIKVKELDLGALEIIESPNDVVVGVKTSRKAVAEDEEEVVEEAAAEETAAE